jgi:hypothetical protein
LTFGVDERGDGAVAEGGDGIGSAVAPFSGASSELVGMQRAGAAPMLATPNCE